MPAMPNKATLTMLTPIQIIQQLTDQTGIGDLPFLPCISSFPVLFLALGEIFAPPIQHLHLLALNISPLSGSIQFWGCFCYLSGLLLPRNRYHFGGPNNKDYGIVLPVFPAVFLSCLLLFFLSFLRSLFLRLDRKAKGLRNPD